MPANPTFWMTAQETEDELKRRESIHDRIAGLYKICLCCRYATIPADSTASYCDYCFVGLAAEPAFHRLHCKKAKEDSHAS